MALAQREVKITFRIKDEATGDITRITKTMEKGLTQVRTAVQKTTEHMGKTIKETRVYESAQKSLGLRLDEANQSLSRWGRRIGFTGFILAFTARRIIKSVRDMVEQFVKVGLSMADTDKTVGWLGETLEKLALAGMLTRDKAQEVIGVFERWFDVSTDLAGLLADIDTDITNIKVAIAEGMRDALTTLKDKMDEVDWDAFTTDVREAAEALTLDLIEALLIVIGEEGTGLTGFGDKLKSAADFLGGFSKGIASIMRDIMDFIGWLADAIGSDDEEGGGVAGLGFQIGRLAGLMVSVGSPMSLFGSTISGIALVFDAAVKSVGLLATALGVGPLALGGAIIILAATVALHWPEIKTALDGLWDAVVNLGRALGIVSGEVDNFKAAMQLLKDITAPIIDPIIHFIDSLAWSINALADAYHRLDIWRRAPYAGAGPLWDQGGRGSLPAGQRQWGGPIGKTGMYYLHRGEYVTPRRRAEVNVGGTTTHVHVMLDGRQIAHHVSRSQGRRVRSAMIIP